MKRKETFVFAGLLAVFAISTSTLAANKKASDKPKATKMTCEEFLTLDEVIRPKLVYWANGYNWWGSPNDAYVDVEETERLVPVVIEECKKTPKQPFVSKVKTVSHKKG